jgi:hypothetical protein
MDTHHIHGTAVGFHSGTEEAQSFLKHEGNRYAAQGYLEQAEKNGEAHFYADGKKYTITHEKDENGQGAFSVTKSHYS